MSISVKNITVSINGTQSNRFNIELSGCKFAMSNFVMTERLLSHARLSFNLTRNPDENISDTQFQVGADIIGKEVVLTLQTDPMEGGLAGYDGDSVADIEFKGFILSARSSRSSASQFVIMVEAVSYDAVLDDHPDYRTFEKMMVKDIIEDQLQAAPKVDFTVDPAFSEIQPDYCAKWKETTWGFICRMAVRYGEWLFHDGRKLYFGKMPEKDAVRLHYPSREMFSYSISMDMAHLNFHHIHTDFITDNYVYHGGNQNEMGDMLNQLNEAVFNASKENFPYATMQQYTPGGLNLDDEPNSEVRHQLDLPQAKGTKAGLLTYSGQTSCSKLSVGVKLTVIDNYITDSASSQKSDVPQEEILVTGVTHTFSNDDTYSNSFTGLAGKTEYPPYANAGALPFAMPTRAWVRDNNDPERMGRVRVLFPWAAAQKEVERDEVLSPWIRVQQHYATGDRGLYVIPEVSDEVMVDFEAGNAEMPYVRASNFNCCVNHMDDKWTTESTVQANEVKAFRTRNGHTVEIHDLAENGYIRIYDYQKENYILTFSTDEKLIKLESTGNIELYAKNDIIMKAGHNIEITAGNDKTEEIGHDKTEHIGHDKSEKIDHDHTVEVEHDYERSVGNDTRGNSGRNTSLWSGNDTGISADHDLNESADNDMYLHAGNDRTVNIERNDTIYVSQNQHIEVDDSQDVKITNKQQTHAMDIRVEADNKLEEQSMEHVQKANAKMNINAQATIDIKSALVKIN